MNEPKPVDPNLDPNATPPKGDDPPAGDENTIEHWQKKYGDGENEKGELRKKLETEQAETNFWRIKAQDNSQPAPQEPQNGDVNLDPMDENFGKNLVTVIGNVVTGAMQTQSNRSLVERHTQELMDKYNLSQQKAQGILNYGYNNGANTSEQAKAIFTRDLAGMGSEFLGGDPPPNNQDPNPNPNPKPNQIKYPVTPPTVPTGGEDGSDSAKIKMPSVAEYELMTPEEKRDLDKKIIDGKVEPDSTHAKFSTTS